MENLVMGKVIIPITECKPGMTLMQPIVEEHTGEIIVDKDQILAEEHIEKLKNFNHTEVWISISPESSVWKIDEDATQSYTRYVNALKAIMETHKDEATAVKQLKSIAEEMLERHVDDYKLLSCINLMSDLEASVFKHSVNVAFLSLLMGRWTGYKKEKLRDLVLAALLHDIGKRSIERPLIHKKEEMKFMERLEYKRHPIYGYEMLVPYGEVSIDVLKGVLSHHERCDGSGYPLGLRENRINEFAKIIGIADTYDYLKEEHHIFEVVKRLGNNMIRKFDINLLVQFCYNIANYYVGSSILLNNGKIAKVAFIQSQAIGRPFVILDDQYINLYEKTQLEIVEVL